MIITQYVTIRNIISTKIDKKIRPCLSLYHFFYFGSVKLPCRNNWLFDTLFLWLMFYGLQSCFLLRNPSHHTETKDFLVLPRVDPMCIIIRGRTKCLVIYGLQANKSSEDRSYEKATGSSDDVSCYFFVHGC